MNYYVFDILNLDGNSSVKLSLIKRKELLKIVIYKQKLSNLFYFEHTVGNGMAQFKNAIKNQSEGIMAKKADSN